MPTEQQRPDGTWEPAQPVPARGWARRAEQWCYDHGRWRTAALLARWDERRLGR